MLISKDEKGIYLSVKVVPGAKRNAVDGVWNGTHIKIALQAPAVDGKANDALIDFLSETLDVKKKNIFIVTGEKSRCKILLIQQISERTEEWLKQRLLMESK